MLSRDKDLPNVYPSFGTGRLKLNTNYAIKVYTPIMELVGASFPKLEKDILERIEKKKESIEKQIGSNRLGDMSMPIELFLKN